jgi:hypothetical protein
LLILYQSDWRTVQGLLVGGMEAADNHAGLANSLALLETNEHHCIAAE